MSKEKKKKEKKPASAVSQQGAQVQGISKRGKKVIAMGIGVLVLGFYILSLTDPAGQNWASNLSPFLILGAYVIIGVGIILPDKSESSPNSPSASPQR